MAKGTRGGQRGISASASLSNISQTQQQSATPQIDTTQNAEDFGKDYSDFQKLSEDEKVDAISKAIQGGVPNHLSNTDFQKVLYNLKFNDKPDLVDDKTLDKMNGTEMFRTVNNVYDRQNDLSYTAKEISKQIQSGSTTRTSDNGGSVYGRGIYFADSYRDSTSYGNSMNDVNKSAVLRAKLNSNAKVISYTDASGYARTEMNNGTKLGKMLSGVDGASRPSIYALVKGYNVVDARNGYYVILNRKAITMSKDVKPISGGKWK